MHPVDTRHSQETGDSIVNEPILWIDLETTGLNPEKHHILEVCAIVTDSDLCELGSTSGVVHVQKDILDEMDAWCTKTHTESGLVAECVASTLTTFDVERRILELIDRNWSQGVKPILAGSSIHFDRRFISKYMQRLDQRLHYRMLDVSALTEAYRLIFSYEVPPPKLKPHRAAADIRQSIGLMSEYRGMMKWGVPL
jgi:oligoribonuclease